MFTRLHLGRRIRPFTSRRTGALLAAAVLALGALSFAPPAQAALTSAGAVDPATQFPVSYTDANGVVLDLCIDPAAVVCLSSDVSSPGGEGFYFDALADVNGITADLALEAAWLNPGEPITFQRIQYQADAGLLTPGETYTMTTPYGVDSCTATVGRTRCRFQVGGAAANDFAGALGGSIGPFLQSVSAPAGFIGDNATPTKVVGSPTGFNKFRVQGPGLPDQCGIDCIQTDQFVIQGRFLGAAPAPVARQAVLPTTPLDLGSQPVANGAGAARAITVVSNGTAALTGITAASNSAEFPVTSTCAATLAPGNECTVSVAVDPAAAGVRNGALTISSNGGSQVIPLSGRGTAGVMSVGPSAVDFGNAAVGSTHTRVVTVSNTGDAAMTFGAATLSGGQAGSFGTAGAVAQACVSGGSIAPGASCQIGVTFRPTADGARSATLSVSSSGQLPLLVALTGAGSGVDRVSPRLASRTPGARAKGVSRSTNVDVRFTEAVRGVSAATFRLTSASGKLVRAKVSKVGSGWRLDPAKRLAAGTKYKVQLVGGARAIRDLAGNALATQRWSFTTQ